MGANFSSLYRDPFFSVAGTLAGTNCRLLWQEVDGLRVEGQLQKRPGRWVKASVLKTVIATRPNPHDAIVVNSETWNIDGEPKDEGDAWSFMAMTDQRRGRS